MMPLSPEQDMERYRPKPDIELDEAPQNESEAEPDPAQSIEPEVGARGALRARARAAARRAIAASGSCASGSSLGPGIAGDFRPTKTSRILNKIQRLFSANCQALPRPIQRLSATRPAFTLKGSAPHGRDSAHFDIGNPLGARRQGDFKAICISV